MLALIKKEIIDLVFTHASVRVLCISVLIEAKWGTTNMMSSSISHCAAIDRFHLEDKIAATRVYLRWIEYATVGFKPATCLMPASTVKSIEVVAPVEIELVQELIISVNFDVVEE